MNSVIEKEKKLNLALTKLKNLNFKNPDIKKKHWKLKCPKKSIRNWKTAIGRKVQKFREWL